MRVAVVDIGTNSTRLLIAEVEDGRVTELERRSTVTRLGRGVDTSHQLAPEAIEDVCNTVGDYIALYEPLEPDAVTAIATSAVRDAENSGAFLAELRERFALDAKMLPGAEEARLTYLGVSAGRQSADGILVIDIGGGSTELVFGSGQEVEFYASLQAGTVRHTERHLTTDPPAADDLEALADDVRALVDAELGKADYVSVNQGIAVAGTATSLAAIEQELDPYDPELVHGFELSLDSIQHTCSMLASKTLEERLQVTGLPPGRAPTIVAGVVILIQVMRAFGLRKVEVSEHDILYGAALQAAAGRALPDRPENDS
jgi:exopolyphosphatase/guanosine-5'-triphosphate,3'-diphosphate pyrophosphatase